MYNLNFSSATRGHFSNVSTFCIYGLFVKKCLSDFFKFYFDCYKCGIYFFRLNVLHYSSHIILPWLRLRVSSQIMSPTSTWNSCCKILKVCCLYCLHDVKSSQIILVLNSAGVGHFFMVSWVPRL